jgi:hypothetical protein
VLTQLRAQPRQQNREAERLGDVVVGARLEAKNRVGIGIVAMSGRPTSMINRSISPARAVWMPLPAVGSWMTLNSS